MPPKNNNPVVEAMDDAAQAVGTVVTSAFIKDHKSLMYGFQIMLQCTGFLLFLAMSIGFGVNYGTLASVNIFTSKYAALTLNNVTYGCQNPADNSSRWMCDNRIGDTQTGAAFNIFGLVFGLACPVIAFLYMIALGYNGGIEKVATWAKWDKVKQYLGNNEDKGEFLSDMQSKNLRRMVINRTDLLTSVAKIFFMVPVGVFLQYFTGNTSPAEMILLPTALAMIFVIFYYGDLEELNHEMKNISIIDTYGRNEDKLSRVERDSKIRMNEKLNEKLFDLMHAGKEFTKIRYFGLRVILPIALITAVMGAILQQFNYSVNVSGTLRLSNPNVYDYAIAMGSTAALVFLELIISWVRIFNNVKHQQEVKTYDDTVYKKYASRSNIEVNELLKERVFRWQLQGEVLTAFSTFSFFGLAATILWAIFDFGNRIPVTNC